MYLLEFSVGEQLAIYIIALVIYFYIFYYIVKSAVLAANKQSNEDLVTQLKMLNQFKVEEMKASGINKQNIQDAIDRVFPSNQKK